MPIITGERDIPPDHRKPPRVIKTRTKSEVRIPRGVLTSHMVSTPYVRVQQFTMYLRGNIYVSYIHFFIRRLLVGDNNMLSLTFSYLLGLKLSLFLAFLLAWVFVCMHMLCSSYSLRLSLHRLISLLYLGRALCTAVGDRRPCISRTYKYDTQYSITKVYYTRYVYLARTFDVLDVDG